jgi:hypothetical protein
VVVIGGRTGGGTPMGDIIELVADKGEFRVQPAGALLAHPRSEHTATRLGDGVGAPVLIAGGLGPGGVVAIAELWRPLSRTLASPATFSPTMKVPRRGHRAELMPDGSVLLIGGLDAQGMPVTTLERFAIDEGFTLVNEELPQTSGVIDIATTRLPDGRILITGGRPRDGGDPVDTAVIARLDVVDGTVDVSATDTMVVARARHHAVLLCDGTVWIGGGAPADAPRAERYNPPPAGRL